MSLPRGGILFSIYILRICRKHGKIDIFKCFCNLFENIVYVVKHFFIGKAHNDKPLLVELLCPFFIFLCLFFFKVITTINFNNKAMA